MEYLLKIQTSKNRKLHTSKNAQDAVEKYLNLALGCEVKLIFAREIPNIQKTNKKDK